MTFNNVRLKTLREKAKMTKTDLIFALYQVGLEISRPTLDSWEAGTTTPKAEQLGILCAYFGVTADWFFDKKKEVSKK